MARLPRRSPVSSAVTQRQDTNASVTPDRDGLAARGGIGLDSGHHSGLDSTGAVGERRQRGTPRETLTSREGLPGEDGVELDAAIDAMLAAGGVDRVTRVRLNEARRAIAEAAEGEDPDGFEGANLSRALFRFVMPRLHHPEVLRAERHRGLLEGLADGLAETDDDGIVREGALVIHRELRRLALLRGARNALVEG